MQSPFTNTSSEEQTCLPGFGQPLNYYPDGEGKDRPFPSALNPKDMDKGRTVLALTTLREFKMLQIMNQITDKPNWNTKVFDEAITEKWKSEALALTDEDITEAMMRWVIDELRYKASVFSQTGAVSVFTGDVVKSDSALPETFKLALQAAVGALEDVPEKDQDWHPGSNGMVLDLVHPSLFPLVYGRSRVLERGRLSLGDCIARCGEGIEIPVPTEEESKINAHRDSLPYRILGKTYSRKFQWLPCEVDTSSDKAKITSYINNLHPERHKVLYGLIEQVIDAAIPLWNMSLAPTVECKWGYWRSGTRVNYSGISGEDAEGVERPEPGTFVAPTNPPQLDLREQFKEKGLQVIVKLANIQLTPENNHYAGGSWHVEGQLNEHICATALYYYSNENIADSTLAFRQQSSTGTYGMNYAQDEHAFLEIIYGCSNNDPGVQFVGGVHTREGRLLTFPNILQHQVQPFGLKDASKPGHRKILALFLVDPHIRVLSTANVPPQQRDWWAERVGEACTGLDRLPQELKDEVFSEVQGGFPISLEEAKELRKELMEERKRFQVKHHSAFEYLQFSLCEH
ncbi:hypothetical protein NLJ89_g2677 [Agrocybe chaxingu]|uniref:Uncharacterized protein n=1 Tax=Agrocybe chaxingu TaxID=84603 RepID=A0A9W8K6C9_9AGAR|nr:hypothetical protein NLJ89_g2677 [Agrocybe chaxingu]